MYNCINKPWFALDKKQYISMASSTFTFTKSIFLIIINLMVVMPIFSETLECSWCNAVPKVLEDIDDALENGASSLGFPVTFIFILVCFFTIFMTIIHTMSGK